MITVALVLLVASAAGFLYRAVVGPSLADRLVAVDALVVVTVAMIFVNALRTDAAWFLDVGLVVAFVGFLGTATGARFIERRGG